MPPPTIDRLAALRASSPVDLAALLDRVPSLASALVGRGHLSAFGGLPSDGRPGPRPSLDRLAALLASRTGIAATAASLSLPELRLLQLAAAAGGTLRRDGLEAEVGERDARHPVLRTAADALRALHLAVEHDDEAVVLRLRPGVADAVDLPGVPFRAVADRFSTSDLETLLRVLCVGDVPPGHARRVAAVIAALRDADVAARLLRDLPPEPARLLRLLAEHGPTPPSELGWRGFDGWSRWPRTPLHELSERGLLGYDPATGSIFTWLELTAAVRGRVFAPWPLEPPAAIPLPLEEGEVPTVPPVVGLLEALLARWAAEPAPALQGGGLGVRSTRAAAKALGVDAGRVGLLAHLATSLGVLGRLVVGSKGRGAARQDELAWAPTARLDELVALAPGARWAHLVRTWLEDPWLDERDGLPERTPGDVHRSPLAVARQALCELLRTLPEGAGLEEADLDRLARWRQPQLLPGGALRGLLAAARALGVVPRRGPVGLTAAARVLLEGGVGALEAALPDPVRRFVVQSDLTVVAPPGLAHDLVAALDEVAVLESDAGARIWRLSEARIEQAVAAGARVEDLEELLDAHASAEVPQVARALVLDAGRRAGRVRAGPASSYLRCDDPLLLARATAVRAAKLRVLAPTVAVSPLGRSALMAALRAGGVAAVGEDASGVLLPPASARAEPDARAGASLPPLDAVASPDPLVLAERLLGRSPDAGADP